MLALLLLTLNSFFCFFCFSVEGVKYEDRACCEIGSNVPSETCGLPDEIDTVWIGIVVGSIIVSLCIICCCGWVFYKCYKQIPSTKTKKVTLVSAPPVPVHVPASTSIPISAVASAFPGTNALPAGYVVSSPYAIPGNNVQVSYGGSRPVMPTSSSSAPPVNPAYYARN